MLYLFFGQDTYRLQQKIRGIILETERRQNTNVCRFDLEENDFVEVRSVLQSESLFADSKIVIVNNFLNIETLQSSLKSVPDSRKVTVILRGGETTANDLARFKNLKAEIQEFKSLSGVQLKNWVEEEAKKRGLKLFPAHWARLAVFGSDTWALANELDKISVENTTTTYHLQPTTSYKTIFDLGDSFFTNKKTGLHTLLQLLNQGEDEFGLFAYLANQARSWLVVKNYSEKKEIVPADFKTHPYVIKKAAAAVRNMPQEKLLKLHQRFFEEDWKIKTGRSSPRESLLFIHQFCHA